MFMELMAYKTILHEGTRCSGVSAGLISWQLSCSCKNFVPQVHRFGTIEVLELAIAPTNNADIVIV